MGLVITAVALLACLSVFLTNRGPIGEHLRSIDNLRRMREPKRVLDYLSSSSWAWYLHGRPTPMQRDEEIAEHYEWLVDLGSFETRKFYLTHRAMDQSGWMQIRSFLTNANFSDRHWQMKTVPDTPSVITITASRKDMPTWESIVSRFDAPGSNEQPGKH